MTEALLTGVLVLWVLMSAPALLRRNLVAGLIYVTLFIYTVFTQIGYAYVPDLAVKWHAYLGPDAFYPYWLFVFLSMIATFIAMYLFVPRIKPEDTTVAARRSLRSPGLFFLATIAYVIALTYMTVAYYDQLSYSNADLPAKPYGQLFYSFGPVALAVYAVARRTGSQVVERIIALAVLAIGLGVFVVLSIRTGLRLQLATLPVGVALYEWTILAGTGRKRLLPLAAAASAVAVVLLVLAAVSDLRGRQQFVSLGDVVDQVTVVPAQADIGLVTLVDQEYFVPSLVLLVSIDQGIVDPGEVIRSNLANSVVGLGYPFLSESIGSAITDTTRTRGYAYYFFTEGFNAAGWAGVIYNGLVAAAGAWLWCRFLRTKDRLFLAFMTGVLAMHVLHVVRGQSVYFLRDTYLFFLPAIVLFYLGVGRPKFSSSESASAPGAVVTPVGTPVRAETVQRQVT